MKAINYPTTADATDIAAAHIDWCIECDPENVWQQWNHDQLGLSPEER